MEKMKSLRPASVPELAAAKPAVTALRRTRRAIGKVDDELDGILGWLHDPGAKPDSQIPDRLARRLREADLAMGQADEAVAAVAGVYASTAYVLY